MDARLEGIDAAARRLGDLLGDAGADVPRPSPLPAAQPPRRVVAIDGSHAVLADAGAFLLGVHRAATVQLAHDLPPLARTGPTRLSLIERGRAREPVADALARAGLPADDLPPSVRQEEALDLLRGLDEWTAALAAGAQLEAGDLLLVDGALRARPFPALVLRLIGLAQARGFDVVGVCKSTSLRIGGTPALAALHLATRAGAPARWHVELPAPPGVHGRLFVARLSSAEPRAFRFDVLAADGDPTRVLARLCGLAGHPAYPGYPSPLAMAHNAATIPEEERERLARDVEAAALGAGVREDAWRAAFGDYHEVLELGV